MREAIRWAAFGLASFSLGMYGGKTVRFILDYRRRRLGRACPTCGSQDPRQHVISLNAYIAENNGGVYADCADEWHRQYVQE